MANYPIIVSLEANIGAGKTTVLQCLQNLLENRVTVLEEPVDEWTTAAPTIFDEYYKDPTKYAFSVQTMIYSSIRKRLQAAVELPKPIVFT